MIPELPDVAPDTDRLSSLLFELASQLHAERARRIALEVWLEEAGLLPEGWDVGFQSNERFSRRRQEALDDAMQRFMQIMAESDDPKTPLRAEAAGFSGDAAVDGRREAD
jgi:hypothetical protein